MFWRSRKIRVPGYHSKRHPDTRHWHHYQHFFGGRALSHSASQRRPFDHRVHTICRPYEKTGRPVRRLRIPCGLLKQLLLLSSLHPPVVPSSKRRDAYPFPRARRLCPPPRRPIRPIISPPPPSPSSSSKIDAIRSDRNASKGNRPRCSTAPRSRITPRYRDHLIPYSFLHVVRNESVRLISRLDWRFLWRFPLIIISRNGSFEFPSNANRSSLIDVRESL